LGALAAAVDAFDGDQPAAGASIFRWMQSRLVSVMRLATTD
jgi:hypothetical protein